MQVSQLNENCKVCSVHLYIGQFNQIRALFQNKVLEWLIGSEFIRSQSTGTVIGISKFDIKGVWLRINECSGVSLLYEASGLVQLWDVSQVGPVCDKNEVVAEKRRQK